MRVVSTVATRLISGTYNFIMNRNVVFKSGKSYAKMEIYYLILRGSVCGFRRSGLCIYQTSSSG